MPKFVQLLNGVVQNTCESDLDGVPVSPLLTRLPKSVRLDGVDVSSDELRMGELIGRTYADGVFGPALPPPRKTLLDPRDFILLFTPEEFEDIDTLVQNGHPRARYFWALTMAGSRPIDLTSPTTEAGLALLEVLNSPKEQGKKVLKTGRKSQILAGNRPPENKA